MAHDIKRSTIDLLAALSAVYAAYAAVTSAWSAIEFAIEVMGQASSGIAAVSAGFVPVAAIELLAAVVVNRLLAPWARRAGRLTTGILRAHTRTLIALPITLFALLFFTGAGQMWALMSIFIGWPLLLACQWVLLAALLAIFVWWRRRLAAAAA
jgi:hypothetical protein